MKIDRRHSLGLIAAAAVTAAAPRAFAAPAAPGLRWYATTQRSRWQAMTGLTPTAPAADMFKQHVQFALDKPAQPIEGFGGAFSEKGWQALSALPQRSRDAAMAALFADDGAALDLCRTPLGANDISRGWYSYDETDGDFALDHFSIANDRETLIPFIKAAQRIRPDLKLWASPWSPPTWMKQGRHYAQAPAWPGRPANGIKPDQLGTEGKDSFIQDPRYFDAYARYFRRYVEEYGKEGIRIGMVMPQNEFNSAQPFPSCCWTPEGLARFLPYLGREMAKTGTDIFFGTLERGNADLLSKALADPQAGPLIKGVGVQWAGKGALEEIRRRHPDLPIWGSEQECGFGDNAWHYARYGWNTIRRYFNAGARAWHYWNFAMPLGGMSGWGWPQNALVWIDTQRGTYQLTNDYWMLRHLSAFVKPGARFIPNSSFMGFENQIAFRNPDGEMVIVVQNEESTPLTIGMVLGGKQISPTLPADSFNTIVVPAAMLG
ncbi:MAG: glycoside hydrolase family 30 protein [Sphingomonadales bacterium]|nr:glycoside hydrolase family 30 protein [Sphingomonadales bacterium]